MPTITHQRELRPSLVVRGAPASTRSVPGVGGRDDRLVSALSDLAASNRRRSTRNGPVVINFPTTRGIGGLPPTQLRRVAHSLMRRVG